MTTSTTTSNTALSPYGMTSSSSNSGSLITTGPLDVTTLVSQLMTVEQQPMTRLQHQQTAVQSKLSAYGQVQSALSALDSAAAALQQTSAFQTAMASVTGSGVTATVSGSSAPANYAVAVSQLALSQSVASAPFGSASTVVGTGTLNIQLGTYNGTTFTPQPGASSIPVTIDSTNNTLSGIAGAINTAAAGSVQASVVTDSSGSRLVLSSAKTGAVNGFSMTITGDGDGNNLDNAGLSQLAFDPTGSLAAGKNMAQTQAAQDAKFSVNGLSLTSASNTVTQAVAGLTLNLTQAPPAGSPPGTVVQAQVAVGTDANAVSTTVSNFVQAYNKFVSLAHSLTSYDATTKSASVLNGESSMRQMLGAVQNIAGSPMAAATGDYAYLSQVGVSVQSDGTLALNSTQFQAALGADPNKVARLFATSTGTGSQQGFAFQLTQSVEAMIGPQGMLGAREQGLQSQVTSLTRQETSLQSRLDATQQRLLNEYSKLNAALTAAQQQQSSLASALAGLSTTYK